MYSHVKCINPLNSWMSSQILMKFGTLKEYFDPTRQPIQNLNLSDYFFCKIQFWPRFQFFSLLIPTQFCTSIFPSYDLIMVWQFFFSKLEIAFILRFSNNNKITIKFFTLFLWLLSLKWRSKSCLHHKNIKIISNTSWVNFH